MIKQSLKFSLVLTIGIILNACSQGPRPLELTIKQDNLCAFTDNTRTFYGFDNTFLISVGKIDYTKEFESTYEKLYKNAPLPIDEKNCVLIPFKEIEKNVAYDVILNTNKYFQANVCLIEHNNNLSIKYVDPGKSTCD
ncbi:NF045616 family extracytoplasmic (lipo)protein [Acinetobacter haemolyticus]|uniref:NF045616 family extracytoplasmic (lipo)protein n=1 Tax=Acinetobacter haemolyticus TaxID=29430 RepID=UPI000DEBEA11|nr:NF045616 family extracytoplasmic (lipo)protein [Acinetobacter haemolyticus]WHR57589.1 hypothetical protein PGW89_14400 [Acinetobacter haemolyticus]